MAPSLYLKMDEETRNFIENVDAWVKEIKCDVSMFTDVSDSVKENCGNVQHNYELIYELKEEIDSLKRELNAMKLIQLATIKSKVVSKA